MVLCPLRATAAWSASPPLMPGPTWAPPLAGRLRPARGLLAGRRMPCRPPRKWWPRLLAGRHMPCRPPRKWCSPMPTGGQRPRHPSAWHCQPLPRGHGWTKSPPPCRLLRMPGTSVSQGCGKPHSEDQTGRPMASHFSVPNMGRLWSKLQTTLFWHRVGKSRLGLENGGECEMSTQSWWHL